MKLLTGGKRRLMRVMQVMRVETTRYWCKHVHDG
jgi:hypothetical protein